MGKKVVAKTDIKHVVDGEKYNVRAGEVVDPNKFTKQQLEQLYDAGAVELQETADAREEDAEPPVTDEPVSPPAVSVKSTPAKATTSEAKSGGKGNAA